MQSTAFAETSASKANHQRRHQAWQFRFSELLSPKETFQKLTESNARARCRTWAVRVELPTAEARVLEVHLREQAVELDVEQLASGQSIALLRAWTQSGEFRFGVPLWQPDAQDWLFDAMDHARLLVLLDAGDGLPVAAVSAPIKLKADRLSAVAAATLAPALDSEELRREVLAAAHRLLGSDAHRSHQCGSALPPVLLSLTGRAGSASAAMGCLIEASSRASLT